MPKAQKINMLPCLRIGTQGQFITATGIQKQRSCSICSVFSLACSRQAQSRVLLIKQPNDAAPGGQVTVSLSRIKEKTVLQLEVTYPAE